MLKRKFVASAFNIYDHLYFEIITFPSQTKVSAKQRPELCSHDSPPQTVFGTTAGNMVESFSTRSESSNFLVKPKSLITFNHLTILLHLLVIFFLDKPSNFFSFC